MARLFIAHMFYKGQIMLHRQFLYRESPSREEDTFVYSRNACIDASLGTLNTQHILDEETCQTLKREEEITEALRITRVIWMRRSAHSEEAKKAAETVGIVLARAEEGRPHDTNHDDNDIGRFTGGRDSLPNPASSTTNGSEMGTALDGRAILPDSIGMGFYEPDRFVIPGLLGSFTPPDQQNSTFGIDALDRSTAFDDWMLMNWPGATS
ncbi:hypothetical protein FQN49_003639 [Arthroderma sp. PD_2]|nr:hypothetical protein FQN49_003639 [Arthroderma sp. PD_2]